MKLHSICAPALISTLVAVSIPLGALARHASDQDPAQSAREANERAERLEEMKQVVRSFKVVAIDDQGKETPAIIAEEPLHRWTDPTRDFHGGALWVWRASGRPVAVIGVELYASWSLEFVAVSTGRVKADNHGGVRWTPRKGGVEFHEIPQAPAPAAGEPERLRQMRELTKRFSAREYWIGGNGQHYALRLLPHPIDRYSDPPSGVVDGALFVYANGTNPESLLLIEARRRGNDPPKWSFAAAPFSHAEVSLKLGSRDVWTSPSKDTGQSPTPDDPYYVAMEGRRSSVGKATPGKGARP
jgi:hypothetical protein